MSSDHALLRRIGYNLGPAPAMMELLENLTIRPEGKPLGATSGDLLSHVLAQIRLTGDVVLPPSGRRAVSP